ncbi:carbamoylphosphate synthase large subunit (plasmid) [Haloferax mediterranei ATCC 33500]|uniref:Carbamoylphosphate synthase large subunit n=1 Tax=Haloferax mediterranei (strain ATCC 33500 / DSM 1411 / JCM 8866 / NBRC 14739 / NCIMB 2177 / R-4) TaxID=523841 RepID=A0A059TWA4_HALMT|nr:carbamoylphosphate synthase large subunit [Haloferax mediterranei ATCC 33500]QCQ77101.1 carbamoylphosphate synthase large subunit [Haloferax mediterranei ATCC 33500]
MTVMVAGAGRLGTSGIVKALRQTEAFDARVVGVDTDPDACGFSFVDTAATVSPVNGGDYISDVRGIARREDVDVILPLMAAELRLLAEAKSAFENDGIEVMVSDPRAVSITSDTGELYDRLAKQVHPSVPEFYRVTTPEEFIDAVHALGYPHQRVCFKPSIANEMRGFHILDSKIDRSGILTNQKPNSTVTTLDNVLPILMEIDEFPNLVVMEYLPGEEFTVDALSRTADTPVVVSRSHNESCDGHSFTSTVEERPELIERTREICSFLELEYNVAFQFKYTASGVPKLLTVDPCLSESIAACVGAGANMPALGVQYALGRELPPVDIDWGTRVARDWQEVFYGPDKELRTI